MMKQHFCLNMKKTAIYANFTLKFIISEKLEWYRNVFICTIIKEQANIH